MSVNEKNTRVKQFLAKYSNFVSALSVNLQKTDIDFLAKISQEGRDALTEYGKNTASEVFQYSDVYKRIDIRTPPSTPSYIYVNTNNETVSATSFRDYIIVDSAVTYFEIQFNNLYTVAIANTFIESDLSSCYISVNPLTNNIIALSGKEDVYVSESVILSASNNQQYTLYYFTTGSLILGYANDLFTLPLISAYPVQTPPLTSI